MFDQGMGDLVGVNKDMENLLRDIKTNTGRDPIVLEGAGLV
jgi:hypothetical protein